jgi:hypothetical protein
MKTIKGFSTAGSRMLTPVLASDAGSGAAEDLAGLAAKLLPRTDDGVTIVHASEIVAGLVDARFGLLRRGQPN